MKKRDEKSYATKSFEKEINEIYKYSNERIYSSFSSDYLNYATFNKNGNEILNRSQRRYATSDLRNYLYSNKRHRVSHFDFYLSESA